MNIRSMLNLINAVTVTNTVETSDGMGGLDSTTSSVILSRAAIWGAGSASPVMSDKITKMSTHVLCFLPDDHTFTASDTTVSYNGFTYKTVGHGEDIMNYGEVGVIGLERMS